MHPAAAQHHAFVECWLEDAARHPSTPSHSALLERALAGLWSAATITLGEIRLSAIADRVFSTASQQFPFVSIARIESTALAFAVRPVGAVRHEQGLREVVCFVLAEFLGVLGTLTDEILTPKLRTALADVTQDEPARDDVVGSTG